MINVYLDNSGSMTEMGKDHGSVYIAKSIVDYCDAYGIVMTITKLDGNTMKDPVRLVGSVAENSILLSDGLFLSDAKKMFDIAIAVGIDSDEKSLEKIAGKTFQSDDIIKAMEYLIFHNNLVHATEKALSDDEW